LITKGDLTTIEKGVKSVRKQKSQTLSKESLAVD
jgi:hypothetical protein